MELKRDNTGYYYQTLKGIYRIYTLKNDEKVVIFAEYEHDGGIEEKFVNWLYMSDFENNAEEYKEDIALMVSEYEANENG